MLNLIIIVKFLHFDQICENKKLRGPNMNEKGDKSVELI